MAYSTILVGTDGSRTADRAVEEASRLAGATGANLVVSCVYAEPTPEELDIEEGFSDAWHITAVAQAEDLVVRAREIAARAGVRSEGRTVSSANPGQAIVELAEEIGADVIVVGSVGLTGAKRFVLGSVPGHVMHQAGCDVLIARTQG